MILMIKSSEEFESLLDALTDELVNANIFFRLYDDLTNAIAEYEREFNQSHTFWKLTFQAHLDASLFRLCRVYDKTAHSLSLRNLLDTIKGNLDLFEVSSFKKRLKDNPFVESLALTARKPDIKQLDVDIDYVSTNNPLVRNLILWRNKIFAHRDARNVIVKERVAVSYPLTISDISELLERGMTILNRYSSLFRASSSSTQIVGHDDYQYVLHCIRSEIKRHEDEFAAELKRYEREKVDG
jgi:hypothetical protein